MVPLKSPAKSGMLASETTFSRKGERPKVVQTSRTPLPPEAYMTEPLGSVGIGLSVGMNTDFGREKIEVSAWCTLPCGKEDVQDTYDLCYGHVTRECKERLDDAITKFFPELEGQEEKA